MSSRGRSAQLRLDLRDQFVAWVAARSRFDRERATYLPRSRFLLYDPTVHWSLASDQHTRLQDPRRSRCSRKPEQLCQLPVEPRWKLRDCLETFLGARGCLSWKSLFDWMGLAVVVHNTQRLCIVNVSSKQVHHLLQMVGGAMAFPRA